MEYKHIMVPLDGSALAESVFPHLQGVTAGCEVKKITLVRVVEPFHTLRGEDSRLSPEEKAQLDEDAKEIAHEYLKKTADSLKLDNIKVDYKVLFGKPAEVLGKWAPENGVDLIILSTHGRSGVSRLLWGSVADKILRITCAPVFMIRAPGCPLPEGD